MKQQKNEEKTANIHIYKVTIKQNIKPTTNKQTNNYKTTK